MAGLVLVAPALPTNDPKNSWSTGGGLGRKLRFAATRAILQVRFACIPMWRAGPPLLPHIAVESASVSAFHRCYLPFKAYAIAVRKGSRII